jgi:hypothetical protein
MTALATKPRHEPEERDDPRNTVLDLVETSIRQVLIANPELEVPLRARLARLLPEPVKPADQGDLWEASVVMTALVECRRKIRAPSSVKQIEFALGFARARFEKLKGGKS